MTRLVAVAATVGLALLPQLADADSASPSAPGQPTPGTATAQSTFVVGVLQDVDSLNPFAGILPLSHEAW